VLQQYEKVDAFIGENKRERLLKVGRANIIGLSSIMNQPPLGIGLFLFVQPGSCSGIVRKKEPIKSVKGTKTIKRCYSRSKK
jgi:hypothetical protein